MVDDDAVTVDAGRYVGQSVQRKEDPRLVSGRGTYVGDVVLPGMLHGAFVRSDIAAGRLVRVDVTAARALPGVRAVLTAGDLAPLVHGPLTATMYLNAPIATMTPLAGADVHFVGQAIALVVADSRYLAEDACELVEVEYDIRTPIVDMERAAEDTEHLVHPSRGTNVMARTDVANEAVEVALASSAHVITRTFHQHRQSQAPMETHGIVVSWNRLDGDLRIWSSSQRVHEVKATAARVTGIADNLIHVRQRDVGGGFGQKGSLRPEEIAVVLAGVLLETPVKWIEDRRENLLAGGHARTDRLTVTMGVEADGAIAAVHLDHLEDVGAFPAGGSVGALVAMMFPGPYRIGALSWSSAAVFTNTGGRSPYRGPWNLESVAREQMMDYVAEVIGMDPVALRLRNVIGIEDMPFCNAGGLTYQGVDPRASLERALDRFDYDGFRQEQRAARAAGRRIGVGIALFVEPTALGAGSLIGNEAAQVRISLGGKVTVALGTSSHGQSIATTMAQIAADEIGVDIDDVVVVDGDTDATPAGGGTGGSRSGVVGGAATHLATRAMRLKLIAIAAELLEAAPEDVDIKHGSLFVRGTPGRSVPVAEIAHVAYVNTGRLPAGMDAGLETFVRYSTPDTTYANACHICTVEIDETGIVSISRYVVDEDCGAMINPMVVEGQITGGVAQGIGGALYERLVYDEEGNPLATTLLDYLLPTASDVPHIEIGHAHSVGPGPGGYKGVGEGGAIGAVPAIRNAISDALGVPIVAAPLPSDLYLPPARGRPESA